MYEINRWHYYKPYIITTIKDGVKMNIRTYEDYQEQIKPIEDMERFNKLVKKCKSEYKNEMDFYAPQCKKYDKKGNFKIPVIVIKSKYDGNFYNMPLSDKINIQELKKFDFNKIDYTKCRYLNKLPVI